MPHGGIMMKAKHQQKNNQAIQIRNQISFKAAKKDVVPVIQMQKSRRTYQIVLLFLISFLIHTILNIYTKENVTVVIDEGLYTNIARSLAWDGILAFRGQPINYPYLLYPFLLVPLYWANRLLGGDIYRIIQIFNTFLITSSVFPIYFFASDFTKNHKKSLAAALIVAFMPDMIMGGYEMTECLIWPLALWMIFFSYRLSVTNQLKYGLLTALFTGLMFASKPGAIAVGAVMLVFYFIRTILKDRKHCKNAVLSLSLLIAIIGLVYGIFLLLSKTGGSLLGLYTKQTEEWTSNDIWVALEAVFLLIFLFIFACGGIFGIFPIAQLSDYEEHKRPFISSFLLGLLTVLIGTAIFVVPYKWTGALGELPLHLRYCSMFIPLMFVLSADRFAETKKTKIFIISLIIFIVLSIFPGVRAGFVKGETAFIDSMTLNSFFDSRASLNGKVTGWILTILVVAFSVFVLINTRNIFTLKNQKLINKKSMITYQSGVVFLVFFMLFNSVCVHVASDVGIDPTLSADALEVNETVKDHECLGITQRYYDDIYSYWLESRLNAPMQQVTIDQMFIQMEETNGIYAPFIPVEQSPNINNHKTPSTNTFILGKTIAEHLELSDTTSKKSTSNNHFTIVYIQDATRWVDSMMYGLDDNTLYNGSVGYIHIFNDDRNIDGNLYLIIAATGRGRLLVDGTAIELNSQESSYEISVPYKSLITLQAENGNVEIISYTTKRAIQNESR